MSLRKVLEKQPTLTFGLIACVLIAAGLLIAKNMQSPSMLDETKWAFDLNTGKIFRAEAKNQGLLSNDSGDFAYPGMNPGAAGVDANIFGCESCDGIVNGMTQDEIRATGARFDYVSRINDVALKKLADRGLGPNEASNATLVSATDGQEWFGAMSGEGQQLRGNSVARCDNGKFPFVCIPN